MAGSKGGRTSCNDYSLGGAGSTHHQLHERELRGGQVGDLGRVGVAWDDILVRLQERLPVTWLPILVIILIFGALPVALVCSTGSSSRPTAHITLSELVPPKIAPFACDCRALTPDLREAHVSCFLMLSKAALTP